MDRSRGEPAGTMRPPGSSLSIDLIRVRSGMVLTPRVLSPGDLQELLDVGDLLGLSYQTRRAWRQEVQTRVTDDSPGMCPCLSIVGIYPGGCRSIQSFVVIQRFRPSKVEKSIIHTGSIIIHPPESHPRVIRVSKKERKERYM